MKLENGGKLCGFTVSRVRKIPELQGTLIEMTHDRTGAALCWLDNGENNKLFSAAFQTLPEDDTGVFHILEHSVFCGSGRYTVREPYVELLKGSMNTFLNAVTYPDKTFYPFSSRNEKDFLNIASVYLDAMFAPLLTEFPNIFLQEGWHTEINDGVPSYKGVVFNEMKGAMSSVDDIIQNGICRLLFPNNCYRFNSGGDPEAIPDLTYEKFVDTYRRFYHPGNARFFLDGDVPLEQTLKLIDGYLSRYEKADLAHTLSLQKPVGGESVQYYEVDGGENTENRAILTMGKIFGTWRDRNALLAAQVLSEVLTGTNESPIKRALLSAGLGEDGAMSVTGGVAQPFFTLQVRNIDDGRCGEIRRTIRATAEKLAEEGLDKNALEAAINRLAFGIRQPAEPKGLLRAINALSGWMYGGDPLQYLVYEDAIACLRKMLENNGFENLLKRLFLDENNLAVLRTLPSATLGREKRAKEAMRLKAEISNWTAEQAAENLRVNKNLSAWQQTSDTPEQLAKLPKLSLSDVTDKPVWVETEEETVGGVKVLFHRLPCGGIVHQTLYFSLADCTLQELTQISLLPSLFGKLPTANYTVTELQMEIKSKIGSLSFGIYPFEKKLRHERCKPYLIVRFSVLEENLAKANRLVHEILTATRFDSPERIREILFQADAYTKQALITSGHSFGVTRTLAHYSAQGAVQEAVGGFTCVQWIQGFAEAFESKIGGFISLVSVVAKRAVCKRRMTLSVTASERLVTEQFVAAYPEGTAAATESAYELGLPHREAIYVPAQVGFAVQGYHLSRCGALWNGSLRVAAHILSCGYLWNTVRVQGGAYGAGLQAGRDGSLVCFSYRDPSPLRSLGTFAELSAALTSFCAGDEELDKYIISTVAMSEPLETEAEKAARADEAWFSEIKCEDGIRARREVLSADKESLLGWASVLGRMGVEGTVCAVGNDEALKNFKCEP